MIEGLKPYAEYKESGLPWLGRCPRHWYVRRTKILFHERVQKGFPNEPLLAATQTKGVVKKEDYETRTVTAQKDLHLLKLVEVGDYVISLRSFQGGIEVAHCRGIISPAYTVLKPQKQAVSRYYSHFFKAKPFIDSLSLFVTGIREGQNIDYERLSRAEMPMPPEDEQAAIVRFLDHANRKIDGFIRAKRKLIGLLNEQKQAIIHRAVTRGLHPDVTLKPSGSVWLGDIPAHWEMHRAKFLFEQVTPPLPEDAGQVTCFRDGQVTLRSNRRTTGFTNAILELGYQGIKPGQLVLHSMDAFAGAIGICDSHGKCSPEYVICEPTMDGVYSPYYARLLRTLALQGLFVALCPSVRQRAPRVRFNDFGGFILPKPPEIEQQRIVEHVERETATLTTAIARTEREIALMQEYRTRLTADLVTGKLDVREAAAKLPESPAEPDAEDALEEELLEETEPEETE